MRVLVMVFGVVVCGLLVVAVLAGVMVALLALVVDY